MRLPLVGGRESMVVDAAGRSEPHSSGMGAAFISLISHRPLTRTRASSELVCAAILFASLST